MDIEDLSKSQLLLLTILVNFVVAIATGVLTVSLLDEAPTTVTQTVNRIVDHTIETVTTQVPSVVESDGGPTTEELLTSAIAGSAARRVIIYRAGADAPVAAGTYVPAKRAVLTAADLPGHVTLVFSNGTSVEADRVAEQGALKAYVVSGDVALPPSAAPRFTDTSAIKAGQTAIALSQDGSAVTGIISKVEEGRLQATLPGLLAGSSVVGLSGEVLGFFAGGTTYIAGSVAESVLAQIP